MMYFLLYLGYNNKQINYEKNKYYKHNRGIQTGSTRE